MKREVCGKPGNTVKYIFTQYTIAGDEIVHNEILKGICSSFYDWATTI